jgi:hypothetical protein
MESFSNTLEACHLLDLGFSRPSSFMKERLDRVLATHEWCDMNPRFWVEVLAARSSNHAPLALSICTEQQIFQGRKGGFRYEAGWVKNQLA